jgi:hypothetical protein
MNIIKNKAYKIIRGAKNALSNSFFSIHNNLFLILKSESKIEPQFYAQICSIQIFL